MRIGQKKTHSIIEQVLNVGSGLIISYFVWILIVAPIWGFSVNITGVFTINLIFTVVSMLRGYIWRRIFDWIHVNGYF